MFDRQISESKQKSVGKIFLDNSPPLWDNGLAEGLNSKLL
jgi:hypothetical protein